MQPPNTGRTGICNLLGSGNCSGSKSSANDYDTTKAVPNDYFLRPTTFALPLVYSQIGQHVLPPQVFTLSAPGVDAFSNLADAVNGLSNVIKTDFSLVTPDAEGFPCAVELQVIIDNDAASGISFNVEDIKKVADKFDADVMTPLANEITLDSVSVLSANPTSAPVITFVNKSANPVYVYGGKYSLPLVFEGVSSQLGVRPREKTTIRYNPKETVWRVISSGLNA